MTTVIAQEPTGSEAGIALGRDAQERILAAKNIAQDELAAALDTPELKALRQELEAAEDALEALRSEYQGGNKAIGDAASAGDADRLAELSLRLRSLPSLILVAEFRKAECELRIVECERPIIADQVQRYNFDRVEPIRADIARLQLELRCYESQRAVAVGREQNLRAKRIALRNRRGEIVEQLQDASTPYALRNRRT